MRAWPLLDRFWDKVVVVPSLCWEWTAAIDQNGYGKFGIWRAERSRTYRAHVIAWELVNAQEVPAGMYICHTCDNRKCVNPVHLFLGTSQENSDDKVRKGRQYRKRTSQDEDLMLLTDIPSKEVARMTGLSYSAVRRYRTANFW